MKEQESIGYENYTSELKKSMTVGGTCLGIVVGKIWDANKEIVSYRIIDTVNSRRRTAHIKRLLSEVLPQP